MRWVIYGSRVAHCWSIRVSLIVHAHVSKLNIENPIGSHILHPVNTKSPDCKGSGLVLVDKAQEGPQCSVMLSTSLPLGAPLRRGVLSGRNHVLGSQPFDAFDVANNFKPNTHDGGLLGYL